MRKRTWEDCKYCSLASKVYKDNQIRILELLSDLSGDTLLDIGCGGGNLTLEVRKQTSTKKAIGMEIDQRRAQTALRAGIHVCLSDASKTFPFKDACFDIIIANQVMEHVLDVDKMLRECYRVLRKDGVMMLSTPNLCSLLQRVLILFGYQPTTLHVSEIQVGNFLRGTQTKREHIHSFSLQALRDLLEYHGFRIERYIGVGFYPSASLIGRFLSWLFPTLAVYLTLTLKKQKV